MIKARHREEVINVKIADELASLGLDADAETIHPAGRPDVIVNLSGIKLVLEGRTENSKVSLRNDARGRVVDGLADIALALDYPEDLYTTKTPDLGRAIQATLFSGEILYFARAAIQEHPFENTSIQGIAEIIRNAFSLLLQNDVVREQVDRVEAAISAAVETASTTNLFFKSQTVRKRLMDALAISADTEGSDGEEEE